MPEEVTVSVLMITYNHEHFIRQALDSILAQNVDFRYEVVVGEDCSTDNTRRVLLEYQTRHPHLFHLILHDKNVGMHNNYFSALQACQGKYVALLEGDDYWTAENKLADQVRHLDENATHTFCFHKVQYVSENGKAIGSHPPQCQTEVETIDLLVTSLIQTCSMMFRNHLLTKVPDWYYQLKMGDYPFQLLLLETGPAGYIEKSMAAYRVHGNGTWSHQTRTYRLTETIKMYQQINAHFGRKYDNIIRNMVARYLLDIAIIHKQDGHLADAYFYLLQSFLTKPKFARPHRKVVSNSVRYITMLSFLTRLLLLTLSKRNKVSRDLHLS